MTVNSLWLLIGALAAFAVAYRLYGAFLATKVAMLDDRNPTPAYRLRDGVDYHPTNRLVLFGHHFAAIAGPGPLVGPVLAAQWGYLPGYVWIIIGACLAGAVHDFVILWASVRQDGKSLAQITHRNIGPASGVTASLATLFIIIITLASVGVVVVKALAESPWGMFTILVTIPAALLTGLWMYKIRPGHIVEASVIGVSIVMLGVILGKPFAASSAGHYLLLSEWHIGRILPAYAFIASVLPVWVLMCPRDYLSSYMKIGVIGVLAVGLFVVHPDLKMPATTPFLHNGPVVPGAVWPFVCIVIMCGALSGFHSLIASGTTPKMIQKESHIRPIGYGAMILEGFVALTALVAACALEPGDYFAINVAQSTPAQQAQYAQMVTQAQAKTGWNLAPVELNTLQTETNEKLRGRTGGAVTLAVGMAKIFSSLPGLGKLMSYWYHFVIMFEALFILTLLETGTRVARFVFQEAIAIVRPSMAPGGKVKWGVNIMMSLFTCLAWGYLLCNNNLSTLWRMLGIANQLLALLALAVGTTYILNHSSRRVYALCTFIPFVLVLVTVYAASVESIASWWNQIPGLREQLLTAPQNMIHVIKNDIFQYRLMSILGSVLLVLVGLITVDAARRWIQVLRQPAPVPGTAVAAAARQLERVEK